MDESLSDHIKRLLFGRIKVRSLSLVRPYAEVKSASCDVAVKRLNVNINASTKSWSFPGDVALKVHNISFCTNDIKVIRGVLKWADVNVKEVKLHKPVSVRSKVNLCRALPQTRTNKAIYARREQFCEKGAIPIAIFCPIIKGKVVKLVLNKNDGVLLVWYSSDRGSDAPYYLALCRKLYGQSSGEDVFWLWVPMKLE